MTAERMHVELHGKKFPLVGPGEFSLGELCDCEAHFGASFGDDSMDARKLASVLYISVRRVDTSVVVDDVRNLTGEQLEKIGEQLQRWQEGDASPPEPPPESDAASVSNGSSGGSSTSALDEPDVIPSLTGSPPSAISAA